MARHIILTDGHSRSSQLYHTKVEQLTTLTNRLNTLARTLGTDYYAQEILQPTFAIGENARDSNVNNDVTPERFSKLEKELVRGKAEVVSSVASHWILRALFDHKV